MSAPDPAATRIVTGVVRKRRSLSKRLTFIDLEVSPSEPSVPLVCDGWICAKSVVAATTIRASGVWEPSPGRTNETRFAVRADGIEIIEDRAATFSAWDNAAEAAAWRARVRDERALGAVDGETTRDDAANANRAASGMCLSWADVGTCADPNCVARHCASTRWEERRRQRAESRRTSATGGDREEDVHGDAAKTKHNEVFATWIVDTFGLDALRGGVVDVAGGRGMLALELALKHGVEDVTLIEPKPLRLNKSYRRRIKKWAARRAAAAADHADDAPTPVRHVQSMFHGVDGDANAATTEASIAFRDASVVLAMHPDQATEPFVDAALALNKNFALVPCCVFAGAHPGRKTADGEDVVTYAQLLDYIQAKAPDVKRDTLKCEGRKVVLYRLVAS